MAGTSNIEWTDATVNFWWGCTKVGPGCDHCYAEAWSKRTGGEHWGLGMPRRKIAGAAKLIHRLDNDYAAWAADQICGLCGPHAGISRRVFIQSMSDLFDLEVPLEWFAEAWGLIKACNRIEVQIVTKRISAVEKRLAEIGETTWPKHAGLIITVVNQAEADRDIPRLLALKAKLGIPWVGLSCEPLLGPIDLHEVIPEPLSYSHAHGFNGIDWVIVGGESGSNARPMHPAWARSLRDQCAATGTPFLFKQWGGFAPVEISIDEFCRPTASHVGEMAVQDDGSLGLLPPFGHERFHVMRRMPKAKAGRLLDGVEHNAFPKVPA